MHVVLAGYVCGLGASIWAGAPPALTAAALLVAGGIALRAARQGLSRPAVSLAALGCFFLLAGLLVGQTRLTALAHSELRSRIGDTTAVEATVLDLPSAGDTKVRVAVRVTSLAGRPLSEPAELELKIASGDDPSRWRELVEGTRLRLPAVRVLPLPEPRAGGFDYARYLERGGARGGGAAPLQAVELTGRRSGIAGLVDRLRLAARRSLGRGLSPPVGPVLQGMVLGDDEAVDPAAVDDFRRSGLLHIMAVSGENVVLLCAVWSFILSLFAVPRAARQVVLLPIIAAYVLVTGASPSIVRAGIAGIAATSAGLVSRPSDGWLLWLLPAAGLMTNNPYALLDVSFQLSFAAVAGLLLLSRRLTALLGFLPAALAEQVGVTTAASLATAPVSLLTFGQVSAVAVPANVAGGFVLGPIMLLGMLSVLAGLALPIASLPLNIVAGVFIAFLLTVARLFGDLSFAVYEWHGPTLGLTLIGTLVVELAALVALAHRAGTGVVGYMRAPSRRASVIVLCAAGMAAAVVAAPLPAAAPDAPTVTFLDVGEGTSTLIQVPAGPTVLVDGGPVPLARVLRAHGVRTVDLLVVSHAHADHVAGLADVIGSVPVRAALLPAPANPSAALERLAGALRDGGCLVRSCASSAVWERPGLAVAIMPTRASGGAGNQAENDCALVVRVTLGGEQVLLTGDAEAPALRPLALRDVAVVEMPHHGSAGGLDEGLVAALQPRLAVISVGRDNDYGHPSAETLALLASNDVPCLRTDTWGEIRLSLVAKSLVVSAARAP